MNRKPWQEHIGSLPHMIEASAAEAGFAQREPQYQVADHIAVVDISGVLVNSPWDGWRTSGYGRVQYDVRAAVDDPEVDGILLRVNSPGGEVTNSLESADAIIAAGKQKPVWAVADPMAYSAGYLLACSAARIYAAPKSGGVGSIGVYAVHLDLSEMLKLMGVKATFIEDPKGKSDGHPYKPLSADAKADFQDTIKYLAGMFFDHVAQRRKMSVEDVRTMRARTFDGAQASIDIGLADRAGTLEQALQQFRGYLDAQKSSTYSVAAASAARSTEESSMDETTKPKVDAQPPAGGTTAAGAAPPPSASPEQQTALSGAAPVDAEGIVALCAVAGLSAKAALDFINQGKSTKDVQSALIDTRASAGSNTEIVSQISPVAGTQPKDASADALKSVVEQMGGGK